MNNTHYDAFISYRHTEQDTRIAREIQQRLERFAIPGAIRKQYSRERIDRIFRDQEELAMTNDLSQELETALQNSDYLIVICSEAYLESRWCLMEIDSFLKTHDYDHVLCVLASGEPPAVFPDQLKTRIKETVLPDGTVERTVEEAEPLACDFRGDLKQAGKIELPRLAARIIGCSYDELMMRRERYEKRRLRIMLTSLITAASAAIAWLLWSNARIQENYRQALINESRLLASESLDAFESRNRLDALETALQALPDDTNDRPVIDEAVRVLVKTSYAYLAPYQYLESWWIDHPSGIVDHFASRDGEDIVFLDESGTITAMSMQDKSVYSTFALPGSVSHIEEGRDHQLITYTNGDVWCVDYRTGNTLWHLPLKYRTLGTAHLSPSGEYIGAADSYAVQIMTVEGKPYLSLPLPEGVPGYVTDFSWSLEDAWIAVKLRDPEEDACRMGVFDFNTSDFFLYPETLPEPDAWTVDSDGRLYILYSDASEHTVSYGDSRWVYETDYLLKVFRNGEIIREERFPSIAEEGHCVLELLDEEQLAAAIGNDLYIIPVSGGSARTYRLHDPVLSVLQYDEPYLVLAAQDGSLTTLSLADGSAQSSAVWQKNADGVEAIQRRDAAGSTFAVSKDGNLYFYENLYDDSLSFYDGDTYAYPVDRFLTAGGSVSLLSGRELLFYDQGRRQMTAHLYLPEEDAWNLLPSADGIQYLLRINGEDGELSVLSCRMDDGTVLKEVPLGVHDYYVSRQLLSGPFSYGEAAFLNNLYTAPAPLAVHGMSVYAHGAGNPEQILVYDLLTGEQRTIDVQLPDGCGLTDGSAYPVPSALLVSDDGAWIFTTMAGRISAPVLIDTETGSTTVLPERSLSGLTAVWADDSLILADPESITACSRSGEIQYTIPLAVETVLAMDYHEGKLFCVFPDGHLKIYEKEKEIRDLTLSFTDAGYMEQKSFSFIYDHDRLLLFYDGKADVIHLSSDSAFPLFTIEHSALSFDPETGELFVSSFHPRLNSTGYALASYQEYTVAELISRARHSLDSSRK